jgi:SAM-dependent methyltransferase
MAHGFEEYYRIGDTPWDIGKPDFNLIQIVTTISIKPCRALEIGCGTGDNAIWLSEQNFTVVGVDSSEIAVDKAREQTAHANVTCTFAVVDFLRSHVEGAPFGFAFDRGCFHTLDSASERKTFTSRQEIDTMSVLVSKSPNQHGATQAAVRRPARMALTLGFTIFGLAVAYFGTLYLISR